MINGMTGFVNTLGDAAAAAPGGAGSLLQFAPFVLIFVVFYFLLIRPQQKKQKELQAMLQALKKGDEVVTTGGVIGKITGLTDQTVTLEVQEKVRMKVLRSHITGKAPTPGAVPQVMPAAAPQK